MNRFFTNADKKVHVIGDFKIPRVWWSRPSEYAFALDYVKEGETVLDVGCGMEHPFKHELGRKCKKVIALDTNPLVTEIKDDNVEFVCEDILTFKSKEKFDKIFIISTLEETQGHMIEKFENMRKLLKDDGKIVITADYPALDFKKVLEYSEKAGFELERSFDEVIPKDALYHSTYKIYVYSLVLRVKKNKKTEKIEDRKTKVEKAPKNKAIKPKRTKKG